MPLTLDGNTGVQGNSGAFVRGTAVSSTSGTSIDFTSIPSWVKRLTVVFDSVSTNGTSDYLFQIGSGSVTTSGYNSQRTQTVPNSIIVTSATNGISIGCGAANLSYSGTVVFTNLSANTWMGILIAGNTPNTVGQSISTTNITLGGVLDRVRITTVNGTDAFDAGSINILYE
jgi:hypothetical protein